MGPLQIRSQTVREILRHRDPANISRAQDHRDHVGKTGVFDAVATELVLISAQGKNVAMWRLLSRPIDLEIAEDNVIPPSKAQVNEGIGHEHAHRIKHVRIAIAIGDD